MKRRTLCLSAVAACSSPGLHASPSAQELLTASDAVRNPGRPFSVKVKLTEFEGGKQVETSSLVTYSRPQEQGGQFATLISFVQPARDAGKLLLKNGDDMWFYDPGTKASIRISPQQRLMGQAANGDVVTINLAKDYAAKIKTEEDLVDGERKTRRTYLLELKATSPTAAYTEIELWVDTETQRPLKARFMAESGRLLKTAYFRRYQTQLGRERPTETVIIDGLNPQAVTLMQFSDFATPSIPQGWFNRDFLPRFQRE